MKDCVNQVTSTGTCPQCGTLLFSEAAAGLCPKCLGSLGFTAARDSLAADPAEALRLPRLGDYQLIEEIARGGMGVVYKARQVSLNRIVAVKVVLHGPFSGDQFVQRFRTETTAIAGLRHPNIVAVYEAGQQGDDHYLAMEYIEGQSLTETVRENPMPAQRAAGYLKTIAEAVQFAHEHGVLHRDLKPSNVLLDGFDQPRIMDFGLAKLLDSDAELTTTGQVLGSPSHIPPEQAGGKFSEAGPCGDVYSLGAILYHLVTGRPPFQGATLQEILFQVMETEPVPPRRLNPGVPVDLQTICLKCLQKDPARRYESAGELAADLARFLANEPIRARAVSSVERLWMFCRRRPVLAGLSAALVLAVALIVGGIVWGWRQANERALTETTLRTRAVSAEREREGQLYSALLAQARATVRSGELGQRVQALDALRRAAAISNTAALRGIAMMALTLPDLSEARTLPYGLARATLAYFDPTFERIAVACSNGPVEIRSVPNGALLTTLPAITNLQTHYARWSSDGRLLLVKRDIVHLGRQAEWEVWDVANSQLLMQLSGVFWNAAAFRPRHPHVVVGLNSGDVVIWDVIHRREVSRFPGAGRPARLVVSPDGERVAVARAMQAGWKITVHDLATGTVRVERDFLDQLNSLDWHRDGRWLAIADSGMAIQLMDSVTGETRSLGRHKSVAFDVVFSGEGRFLFSAGWEKDFICWDLRTFQPAFVIGLNGERLQLRADGGVCAAQTQEALQLHNFERPAAHREFTEDLGGRLHNSAFSTDGRWLAVAGVDWLGVWDLSSDGPGVLTNGHNEMGLHFTPEGQLFTDYRGRCQRWRVVPVDTAAAAPSLVPLELDVPPGFTSLSLLPGQLVRTAARGTQIVEMNNPAGGEHEWRPTRGEVNGVSPDGRWLAMYSAFGTKLYVYRLPDLTLVATLDCLASIRRFQFAPRGDELAVASRLGVEFWSTADWQRQRVATNFTDVIYAPDSSGVWLSTEFRGAGLHDAHTFEPLLPLPPGTLPMAVSVDGRHLAVSVDTRKLQLWDLVEVRRRLRELGLDWTREDFQGVR